MQRKLYTEEKIILILKEHEAGASAPDLSRRHPPWRVRAVDLSLEGQVWWHGGIGFTARKGFRCARRSARIYRGLAYRCSFPMQ